MEDLQLLKTRGPYVFDPWKVIQMVEWEGGAFPWHVFFPDISIATVRKSSPADTMSRISKNGNIISSTQLFILQQQDTVVLIDLGTGNNKRRSHHPYWDNQHRPYLETLASLNIQKEEIGYVFLSHLHVDHIGLATTSAKDRWLPTFPYAEYIVHPDEWTFWDQMPHDHPQWHPGIEDSIRPLIESGCVRWCRGNDCLAGIQIHEAPGHTPGHLLFELKENNIWFIGDLFHHPSQIAHPDWASGPFDADPETNTQQRLNFFNYFADSGAILFASHLGNPFRIRKTVSGQQYEALEKK